MYRKFGYFGRRVTAVTYVAPGSTSDYRMCDRFKRLASPQILVLKTPGKTGTLSDALTRDEIDNAALLDEYT